MKDNRKENKEKNCSSIQCTVSCNGVQAVAPYLSMLKNDLRVGQTIKAIKFRDGTNSYILRVLESSKIQKYEKQKIWTENIRMEMQLTFSCDLFIWENIMK